MFDIAWSEMIVIGAVALIAIGPKDLPKALRAVGAMTAKARRMASEFQDHFREAMREAELESVKEEVANINRDLTAATSGLESEFNTIGSQMPAPSSAPVQLSGAATERDIPGLPQIESKGSEAAEPTATVETPKSAQPLESSPAAAEPTPAVASSVEAEPRSAMVTETPATSQASASSEAKKPARRKRVAKRKSESSDAPTEAPAQAAAAGSSEGADIGPQDAEPPEPAAKPARKRATKALPPGDDRAA